MKLSSLVTCLGLIVSSVFASDGGDLPGLQREAGTRTLYPTLPPGHNASELAHLEPSLSHELHFREAGKTANDISAFGHMITTFQHPTVILDHSAHISSVRCSAAGLTVHFRDAAAEEHATTQWHLSNDSLVVSTHHPGCGAYDEGARSYWRVSAVSFDGKRSVFLTASEIPLEESIHDFDLEFSHSSQPTADDAVKPRHVARANPSDPRQDIADDPAALTAFFGTIITGDYPEHLPEATPVAYNGTVSEVNRRSIVSDIWSKITGVVKTVVNAVEGAVKAVVDVAKKVVNTIIEFGKEIGKLIQDPLGYEWSLGSSISRSWDIGGKSTQLVPSTSALFGQGDGLVISSTGVLPGEVTCENCFAKGEVHVAGRIAFSIKQGLTKGYLNAGGFWDSRLALAMNLQGQKKVEAYKKELLSKNLVNLEIPRIISLGPMVTLSAVFDIYFAAKADILIGAEVQIEKGEATLDLLDKAQSKVTGFTPKVTPIAKYRGNGEVSLTLDFGLPLGLEFGVDLLSGKWKKTVGVFDQPSFQVRAKSPTETCKGIDIGLAVQNYIFVSVGGVYDYALGTRDLWSKNLGCISSLTQNSINTAAVRRHSNFKHIRVRVPRNNGTNLNPGQAVNETFPNGGVSSQPPVTYPAPVNVTTVEPITGFSYLLVTDINQTAIMIAGKEDRIYLAPYGDPDADLGAPFTYDSNASTSVIIGDVFGGYLNYNPGDMTAFGVSNLRSSRLTRVPVGSKFVMLAEVRDSELGNSSGMYIGIDGDNVFALVTCSVINMGTRVYLVDVNSNGFNELNQNNLQDTVVGGQVRGCQYLYLTSDTTGLPLGG